MRPDVGAALSRDTLFVYPTALKADDVARAAARADGCLLGHRITTFPQLVDALSHDLGVGARVLEPHLAAVVLARAAARATSSALSAVGLTKRVSMLSAAPTSGRIPPP